MFKRSGVFSGHGLFDGRDQSVDDNFAAASQSRAGKEARAGLLDESEKRELIVCVTFKTVT